VRIEKKKIALKDTAQAYKLLLEFLDEHKKEITFTF